MPISTQSGLQTGQCNCKPHVTGLKCDACTASAYFNTSQGDCLPCNCHTVGSLSISCDSLGRCQCKPGFISDRCDSCIATVTGSDCDTCSPGFFNFSTSGCQQCSCSAYGAVHNDCDTVTGQCTCLSGFEGLDCSQCDPAAATTGTECNSCVAGYYGYNGSQYVMLVD